MDYLRKINEVIAKLEQIGKYSYVNDINDSLNGSSTSSELLMSTTHNLLVAVREDSEVREEIGRDVEELKKYCWSIGLHVK